MATKRKTIPAAVERAVLIEAGYRCAVPTCRELVVRDLHHLVPVSKRGGNTIENLIVLCPNCHRLHHIGEIPDEAIRVYKRTLEALSQAFDQRSVSLLLALSDGTIRSNVAFSPDSFLTMAPLISAGFLTWSGGFDSRGGGNIHYQLTEKALRFLEHWKQGREQH